MRYFLYLIVIVALASSAGCVFRSGDEAETQAPEDSVQAADGDSGESLADSTDGFLSRELPEGVNPEDVIRVEVPQSSFDGDNSNYDAPAGAEDMAGPAAKNMAAEVIEVRPFDDPDNPYLGQYTEFDQWHYDNFDPGAPFMLSGKPGERPGQLVVTNDGWAEPYLVTMRKSLDFETGGEVDSSQISKDFKLYSRGVVSAELDAQVAIDRARVTAEFAPAIPGWLAKQPPLWALVLPDGHVATVGILGSGRDFYPETAAWLNESQAPACHYDPDGELVELLKPGEPWFLLFFPDFEATMAKHQVTTTDIQSFGKYVLVNNKVDESLGGLYLYDGTQISEEDYMEIRDATRHFEMFGRFIPVMYAAQQE